MSNFFIRKEVFYIMKITLAQLVIVCLLTTLSFAETLVAQERLQEKISLHLKNTDLRTVLKNIEKKADVSFSYQKGVIANDEKIDIEVNNETLETILKKILTPRQINYQVIKANKIVLVRRVLGSISEPIRSTLPEAIYEAKTDQSVTGTVIDENGAGLPGVSILLKGTQRGTTTNAEGKFKVDVPNSDAVLIFSFVGYLSQEVVVGNRTQLSINLKVDTKALEEIIVVGYGTQKKADVTGAVFSVKPEKTAELPNYNVLQSLQGRVPGLNITTPDRAGEDPNLSIRGTNSISAANRPLIVVDGIIYYGSISDFNANDIASVEVLKDASAAAIYGSRSSNGVILITTKTGTSEKPEFNFNTYFGSQQPDRLVNVLDGPGYLQKVLDFRTAKGLDADPAKIGDYLTVVEKDNLAKGQTTDWMSKVLQRGVINNYHLDVSGRNKSVEYYMAGTYFKQDGIVKNDNFKRATFNLNLTTHITDWYAVSLKTVFASQDFSGVEASLTNSYRQSPYGNYFDENGPGGFSSLPVGDALGGHPLIPTLIDNKDIRNSLRGLISSVLDVPFIPGLRWTLNYSHNLRTSTQKEFINNTISPASKTSNGIATKDLAENIDWTFDNILNYRKVVANKHSIDFTGLISREYQRAEVSSLTGNDFFSQALGYNSIQLANIQRVTSDYGDQNSIAYMGRLNYGFDNKYAITLTARRDGFSGFAKNKKSALFPSLALAWTLTNESFFKKISFVNYLKLRVSYGLNGNQAVGRYQSLARITNDAYVFDAQTTPAIYVNSIANNDLSWETTISKNLGIDFELLNNRISGSLDVYSSDTKDILLRRALPETSGYLSILTNIGKVHNKGIEASINTINVKPKSNAVSWESGFVFSLNRNKIVSLTGQDSNKDGVEDDDIVNGWFIGQPLSSFFGYQTDGIYQIDEKNIPKGFVPGDFRIKDTNGDGVLSPTDRVILGNRLPNFTLGVSNTLHYKNVTFYFLLNSIQGGGKGNYYVGNNNATRNVNAPFTTFSERFNLQDVPYWTPQRPSNEYPRIDYNASLPHPILESRSFTRLQDVILSYTFDKNILRKMKVKNMKAYVSGKNLYTYTKWTGYDPENATAIGNFPLLRAYTIGFDFKF
ncbi:MAG: TonB-dependent receptor [Spirosomataceae bacterium]